VKCQASRIYEFRIGTTEISGKCYSGMRSYSVSFSVRSRSLNPPSLTPSIKAASTIVSSPRNTLHIQRMALVVDPKSNRDIRKILIFNRELLGVD
jgi:hypothetical protein